MSERRQPVQLDPGPNQICGPKIVARRFGRGHKWARDLLREWWEEQQVAGYAGPIRVFRKRGRGGIPTLYTTRPVLDAHMPPGRDERMVRAVAALDRDVDALARRIETMQTQMNEMARRIARQEQRR